MQTKLMGRLLAVALAYSPFALFATPTWSFDPSEGVCVTGADGSPCDDGPRGWSPPVRRGPSPQELATALNAEGNKLFEAGDYEGALLKYEQARMHMPNDRAFHSNYLLAAAFLNGSVHHLYSTAASTIREAMALDPSWAHEKWLLEALTKFDNKSASRKFEGDADDAFDRGQYDEAIRLYQRAWQKWSFKDLAGKLHMARAYLFNQQAEAAWNKKDWSGVIDYLNDALTQCANYCGAEFRNSLASNIAQARANQSTEQADAALNKKDWRSAIDYLNEALTHCANYCGGEFRNDLVSNIAHARANQSGEQAEAAWNKKDWRGAIDYLNEALTQCANYCEAEFRNDLVSNIAQARANQSSEQADAAWNKKDWSSAIGYLNEALTQCANYCGAEFRNDLVSDIALARAAQSVDRGDAALSRKNWREAIEGLADALKYCGAHCDVEVRNNISKKLTEARTNLSAEQALLPGFKTETFGVGPPVRTLAEPEPPPKDTRDAKPSGDCTRIFSTNCVNPQDVQLPGAARMLAPVFELSTAKTARDQLYSLLGNSERASRCFDGRQECAGNAPSSPTAWRQDGVSVGPVNGPLPFASERADKITAMMKFLDTSEGQKIFAETNFLLLWEKEKDAAKNVRGLEGELTNKTGIDRENFELKVVAARDEEAELRQQRIGAEKEIKDKLKDSTEFRRFYIDPQERPLEQEPAGVHKSEGRPENGAAASVRNQ